MVNLVSIFNFQVSAQDIIEVPSGMPVGRDGGWDIFWVGIIPGLIQILLTLAFLLSFFYLLWGGISWITSGGNKESLERARKKVTYAILGLVLVLLSFFILFTLAEMFGVRLP